MASSSTMPVGQTGAMPIRASDVTTSEGAARPPVYNVDAVATLVWNNYQRSKNYVENNAWLLEWQEADILYASPIPNRLWKVEQGRPPRVPRFLVAKFSRTLARALKRALFAEQVPFLLRPQGNTKQERADAWTALLTILLRRMKFQYHAGLQINCQVLQGTGLGKYGWEERKVVKRGRRRKKQPEKIDMPTGPSKEIPTEASDEFEEYEETKTESWPFYEYRRLGTTLFDPKWCTPDMPEESAGYCIDVDYVTFADLQKLRILSCYQEQKDKQGNVICAGIPDEETLKNYFFEKQEGSAPAGSQIEDSMSSQGSMVAHAEGRNRQTDISPLEQPLLLLEQWDADTVKTILAYDGRKLVIRNEEHRQVSMSHTSCTWWPVDNAGYGMGIGRINGPDQRVNQGVLNEALKMVAYPMNAPLIVGRGENAPSQNVIARHGGFWQVDAGPSGDVNKAVTFLKSPEVPADAWKFIDLSQRGGEELSGADVQMQQGALNGRQGATRSSFGAQRVAAMSDQNVADPVESVATGVIVPVIQFLIHMVKTKMPLAEIRELLTPTHAKLIEDALEFDQFMEAEFEVAVLAGQKLAAKQGIQQLIPFFLEIVQQPQLLEYLHQRGETIEFKDILDLLLQVSELTQQPDIFRPLTPRERVMVKQMNPGMQRIQAAAVLENLKGANKRKEIQAKGQVDLANNLAERAIERTGEGVPLARAAELLERTQVEHSLAEGVPDAMQEGG